MTKKVFDLNKHLAEEHDISLFSTYVKEIVYGGVDGIVTTFAVVAGFAGATGGDSIMIEIPIVVVILFGFANLFADGASMALGNFLSVRADHDLYRKERRKELLEIRTNTESEYEETIAILLSKGFDKKQATQLADIYMKNETCWVDFMMNHELSMSNPIHESPMYTSLATFLSFVTFGFVPLIPYIFLANDSSLFQLSITFTFIALILLGILRWKVTQVVWYRSVSEIVLLGGIAATIAYVIGSFFRIQ